jgi:hypoxanthine phosphoribosyltransferase
MHPDLTKILYQEKEIQTRVTELGEQITKDYEGKDIVLVSVLRGGAIFMADLARKINLPLEMDFMAVSSYGSSATSSGHVTILKDLSSSIEGKHVIIAEDILDTGLTLEYLIRILKERKPLSIQIAAFMKKEGAQKVEVPCKYVGFDCPNEFVVGYGLDYAEKYRNLPYVGILSPEIYS